jgi:hypothetical protein
MKPKEGVPRAPRMMVRAPVAYRTSSSSAWAEGWTRNISRSGVLLSLADRGALAGDIEFVIHLSRGALQGPGVSLLPDLHCHGRIVRQADGKGGETLVAATIRRQSIERGKAM